MIVFSFFGLLIDPFRLQQSFQTASYTVLLQRIIAKQAKLKPTLEIKDEDNGHNDNDITENRSH